MDKLLLALTLVAFSSGVLCNVAQNLTEGDPIADSESPTIQRNHDADYQSDPEVFDAFCKPFHKLHTRKRQWNDARKSCLAEGGQLVIINSAKEASMLMKLMKKNNLDAVWIGTHDLFEKGYWVTLTGETLAAAGYDYWLPGEPNNAGGNEHCGSLVNTDGMNDLPCDRELAYICKS